MPLIGKNFCVLLFHISLLIYSVDIKFQWKKLDTRQLAAVERAAFFNDKLRNRLNSTFRIMWTWHPVNFVDLGMPLASSMSTIQPLIKKLLQ